MYYDYTVYLLFVSETSMRYLNHYGDAFMIKLIYSNTESGLYLYKSILYFTCIITSMNCYKTHI